jgi:hypothetical protein
MKKLIVHFSQILRKAPNNENSRITYCTITEKVVNFITPIQRQCAVKPSEMTQTHADNKVVEHFYFTAYILMGGNPPPPPPGPQ